MRCCNVRTVVCTYIHTKQNVRAILWEAGCFELVAAIYSDHYGQVPLCHVAIAAMLLELITHVFHGNTMFVLRMKLPLSVCLITGQEVIQLC